MASNRQAVEEQAASWLGRRDGGNWGADDQAHLSQWLGADTHHRVAFLRLEAAWAEMGRLQAIGAGYPRGEVPRVEELVSALGLGDRTPEARKDGRRRAELSRWVILAACLTALLVGGAFFSTRFSRVPSEDYSTPIGGLVAVPLKDGSNITLSSATALRVKFSDTQRQIDLTRGEALFEVAKDPNRPFTVDAGVGRVIAVGTKFSVRRDGDNFRVVVAEGTVRFENAATNRLLPAGSIARASGNDVVVEMASQSDVESFLSWRSGFVVFHETALADAVAEFNRYNPRKIVIADPGIAAIRLTGKFRSTNVESFSRLLQQSLPIRARETPEGIVLSAVQPRAPPPEP